MQHTYTLQYYSKIEVLNIFGNSQWVSVNVTSFMNQSFRCFEISFESKNKHENVVLQHRESRRVSQTKFCFRFSNLVKL